MQETETRLPRCRAGETGCHWAAGLLKKPPVLSYWYSNASVIRSTT